MQGLGLGLTRVWRCLSLGSEVIIKTVLGLRMCRLVWQLYSQSVSINRNFLDVVLPVRGAFKVYL